MQDIISRLNTLHRPSLLMRAARIGAESYRRTSHLRRLLGCSALPRSGPALMHLIEIEAELNDQRKMADASYCLVRHVEVVIAMIGEARVLRNSPDQIT
ncbi:DUF6477 family protein [Sulfitobacter sp. CW3]|uniref:DUF6477 family protein n=1 Tax=Sulfitobacter sp. CW3 TaxID=2861965 RepID=UPI001C5FA371|nr:DUF6477 family protein [Sulfitobacter sp. CW3]MBW4960995.1 hypothetical protein [Sulfitobacter sp. CW3]